MLLIFNYAYVHALNGDYLLTTFLIKHLIVTLLTGRCHTHC
jgi:hypothetical protein